MSTSDLISSGMPGVPVNHGVSQNGRPATLSNGAAIASSEVALASSSVPSPDNRAWNV